jgi:hypothetical protein
VLWVAVDERALALTQAPPMPSVVGKGAATVGLKTAQTLHSLE